jgi:hypothetical protein
MVRNDDGSHKALRLELDAAVDVLPERNDSGH